MEIEEQEVETWTRLRSALNSAYDYSAQWLEAINLYNTRLHRKFFEPLQWVINQNKFKGEGFSIVAVQCALIESFAAFRLGKIHNHKCTGASPKYEYRDSKRMFVDFLNSAFIFKDNFYVVNKMGKISPNKPFSADDFYNKVRCGLLHEARTKGEWIINANSDDVSNKNVFLERSGTKIKIWRTILHNRLKMYLIKYSDELKHEQQESNVLRRLFGRKMDHLFEINSDPINYEWWLDK